MGAGGNSCGLAKAACRVYSTHTPTLHPLQSSHTAPQKGFPGISLGLRAPDDARDPFCFKRELFWLSLPCRGRTAPAPVGCTASSSPNPPCELTQAGCRSNHRTTVEKQRVDFFWLPVSPEAHRHHGAQSLPEPAVFTCISGEISPGAGVGYHCALSVAQPSSSDCGQARWDDDTERTD